MDALTEKQFVVDVYVQVITVIKSVHIYVRWDQVWGTGGHSEWSVRDIVLAAHHV
jgi:hypothetical protein